MNIYSLNTLSDRDFALALRDELWARGLNALTAVVRAGKEAFDTLNGEGEDRNHTVLPGIGWVGLELDETMEPWSAAIMERTGR